jgi:transcription elongation factor Elf1
MYLLFFRRPGKKWSTAQLSEPPSNGMHASSYTSYNSVYLYVSTLWCYYDYTAKNAEPVAQQYWTMFCCPRCSHLSTILNNTVEPESGVTILFNIVDSYEQCWQQNIVQSCFHQYCINLSVFTRVGSLTDHVSIYSAGLGI